MRRSPILILPLALLTAFAGQGTDDVRAAGWLAGCWESRVGPRVTQEQWMAPAGGLMLGMSRTVVRDTARSFELLRIAIREGRLTYTAVPSHQAETHFAATTASDTLLVFENPQHDFPHLISYRRRGADSVIARVEGPQGGQTRGFNIPMRRVACGV